jgi:large subunit ribosomal protein L21
MFVVFENGGKQYKAKKDDVLKLEKFDCKKNDIIKIDNILLLSDEHNQITIGTPHVNGVELHAKVIDNIKDKKVLIFKKKRRHNYRRKLGHRQNLVLVKITDIVSKDSPKRTKSDEVKKDSKTKISKEKVQPKE